MLEPFIINALIAGIGVAVMCGALGCFVAWQRMTYFGETVAHASLLGVVLTLLVDIQPEFGIILVALVIAFAVAHMEYRKHFAYDTLLGIAAHGALALGLALLSFSSTAVDITGYLFGDILLVADSDIIRIYVCAALVAAFMYFYWNDLLRMTLHSEIAAVEGVNVPFLRLLLLLLTALVVSVSIKIVGFLLVPALLIIPAAAARYYVTTPIQMVLLSCVTGGLSVVGGLSASLNSNMPAGPAIIVSSFIIFVVAGLARRFKR